MIIQHHHANNVTPQTELSPASQSLAGNHHIYSRTNSNKASSSKNVDSVVGCSLKLFRRLLSHTSKRKNESRDPRNYNTGLYCLLWTSQPVFNLMRWSALLQPIKFTVTALIPCGRGSNQSTTQFRFWTDPSHGNEVACLCDQWSVSGALSNHRQPKRTMFGFGLQRSFGRNILELLVYYLMPNKCKNLKYMKSCCLSICTSSL